MKARKLLISSVGLLLCLVVLSVGVYAAVVGSSSITSNGQVSFTVKEVFCDITLAVTGGTVAQGTATNCTFNAGTYTATTYSGTTPSAKAIVMSPTITCEGDQSTVVYTFTFTNNGPNDIKVTFASPALPTAANLGTITSSYVLNGGTAVSTNVATNLQGGLTINTAKALVLTFQFVLSRKAVVSNQAVTFGQITISNPLNV